MDLIYVVFAMSWMSSRLSQALYPPFVETKLSVVELKCYAVVQQKKIMRFVGQTANKIWAINSFHDCRGLIFCLCQPKSVHPGNFRTF